MCIRDSLRIDHQPIQDLSWPAMEMNFTLTARLSELWDEDIFKVDDHIKFELKKVGMEYRIDSLSLLHQHGEH